MTHYDVLGVPPDADSASVRRAYLRLARSHHPDVEGGDPARMVALNEAWATLGDAEARARYDRTLGQPTPVAPTGSDAWIGANLDVDVDAEGLLEDLGEDRPVRITVSLPRWVSLMPVSLFAIAVGAFSLGVIMVSEPLLGLALVALVLSCLLFLASPFIALFASRTGRGARRSQQ